MTSPYGDEAEYFKYSVFLVLSNRILSASLAAAILSYTKGMVKPAAPLWKYACVSASNVLATTCQYEALRYVSFPVQTLGKCAKMIPVMIWGYFINQKTYTLMDCAIAACVTLGCTIFGLYGNLTHKHSVKSSNTSFKGLLLMLGYLGFDGFTSTFQDKLFRGYQMETYNQMLYVNGRLRDALAHVARHRRRHLRSPRIHLPTPCRLHRHRHPLPELHVRTTVHSLHHQRVRSASFRRHNDDASAHQHLTQLSHLPPPPHVATVVGRANGFRRAVRPSLHETRPVETRTRLILTLDSRRARPSSPRRTNARTTPNGTERARTQKPQITTTAPRPRARVPRASGVARLHPRRHPRVTTRPTHRPPTASSTHYPCGFAPRVRTSFSRESIYTTIVYSKRPR